MYTDTFKIVDGINWVVKHDSEDRHCFTIKAKEKDWTQMTLSLTKEEATSLVEKLGFAIQDMSI